MIALIIAILAGLIDGTRELSHANPPIFERLFKVEMKSWFGRHSWMRKHELKGWKSITVLSDFWHFAGYVSRAWLILCGLLAGFCDLPFVGEMQMPLLARVVAYYCLLHGAFGVVSYTVYRVLEFASKEKKRP